jgi:hypothetical protein
MRCGIPNPKQPFWLGRLPEFAGKITRDWIPRSTKRVYAFSGKSALRSVALEIPSSPVKGLSSSKIRKIAQANDSAHTNREAMTTKLVCANKMKLTKIALSQKTRMIKMEPELSRPPGQTTAAGFARRP